MKPLIVIVGPTASGKTALAVELAEKYDGEIVCADSRTVYNGMDLGTAKPSSYDRLRVAHWGIDLVSPGDRFTAADFKKYAVERINDIRQRGKVPFLVGGTGLYVDSVIFDFSFGGKEIDQTRNMLEKMTLKELHLYCKKNNIDLPENRNNRRYVIRTIERKGSQGRKSEYPLENSIIVGIATPRNQLLRRIRQRTDEIFSTYMVDEARIMAERFGWENEAMTGNIYPVMRRYINNTITFDEAKEEFIVHDWRLAKRQMTWFRRNPHILWMTHADVVKFLNTRLVH